MAYALQPEGALELLERPVAVELAGVLTRGATVVDWNRQAGEPDNATLLMRYDQARFEGLIRAALAADLTRRLASRHGRAGLKCRSSLPKISGAAMKADIHPEYRDVVFQDVTSDFKILTRSTLSTKETVKWEDGNEYPLIKVDISSASHPFYTGQHKVMDTGGRIDKFRKRYQRSNPLQCPRYPTAALGAAVFYWQPSLASIPPHPLV